MAIINYRTSLDGVDWVQLKQTLGEDDFDNGRDPAQLERSFVNSAVSVIAYAGDRIVGTARALSDGVCNAYIVDVWTYTPYRRQGIARHMLNVLLEHLPGQHVFLWTDSAPDLYRNAGFREADVLGFARVVGKWLVNEPDD